MIQYSRQGFSYNPHRKKRKKAAQENSPDWINMVLFVLLFLVIVLFVLTS